MQEESYIYKDVLAPIIYNREKMEITLMSSTKGMGDKLWTITWMEYITQTLKTNILQNEKVFTKSLKGQKNKSLQ